VSIKVMTEVWNSSTATGTKRLMLLALADHANDEGGCYPSVIGLATKCAISERNAQLILRDLEASGELVTEKAAGRGHKNLYFVLPPDTCARLLIELIAQLEKVKSSDEKVKSSAEKVKFSAQKVKSGAQKVQHTSPEPSVTVSEPSEEPSETDGAQSEATPPAQVPVSAEDQDQNISTGAADAARVNTPTPPVQEPEPSKANGRAPNATSPKDGPGAARPVDNFPDGPCRKFLTGCFGAEWLARLLEEDPSRRDWFALEAETFQASKDDALATSERGKWKSTLISLLDAETASLRRARRVPSTGTTPTAKPQSRSARLDARLAAAERPE